MSSSFLSRQFKNGFHFISNNITKTRHFSSSITPSVNYSRSFKGLTNCTITAPYTYNVKYFNKSNGLFLYSSETFQSRFLSTVPKSQGESCQLKFTEEDSANSVENTIKAYKYQNNEDVSEMVEELGVSTFSSREKLSMEDLFEIPDYHEYLLTRIMMANGTKRSILQRFLPVDYVQQMFIVVHDFTHLSWSATIFLITIFFKFMLLPIWCRSEKSRRMNAHLIPKATFLQEKAKEAFATRNEKLARETQLEIYQITKKNSFIKGMFIQAGAAAVQGLMFGTVYGGLRLFAIDPKYRPDFTFESCLWLDSLCLPDPYFILPCIFGILLTVVFEHNLSVNYVSPDSSKGSAVAKMANRQKYMKIFSRFGILFFTFYAFSMPSSAFFYLIPSFLFQTVLRYSSNRFLLSRLLDIPLPIVRKTKQP